LLDRDCSTCRQKLVWEILKDQRPDSPYLQVGLNKLHSKCKKLNSSLNYKFQICCKAWYVSFCILTLIINVMITTVLICTCYDYLWLTEATVVDFKQGLVHQLQTYSYVSTIILEGEFDMITACTQFHWSAKGRFCNFISPVFSLILVFIWEDLLQWGHSNHESLVIFHAFFVVTDYSARVIHVKKRIGTRAQSKM